jgi:HEAT repeat protein
MKRAMNLFRKLVSRQADVSVLRGRGDVEQLTQLLAHPEPHVAEQAREALGELALNGALVQLQSSLISDIQLGRETLRKLAHTSAVQRRLAYLIERLQSGSFVAAEDLALWGDSRSIPCLIEELKSANELCREAAQNALVKLGDPAAVPHLVALFAENKRWLPTEVHKVLKRLGDVCVDNLIRALQHPSTRVRKEVVLALRGISGQTVIEGFVDAVWRERDRSVRHDILLALPRGVVIELQSSSLADLDSLDERTRERGASRFAQLDIYTPVITEDVTNRLSAALADPVQTVRIEAVRALGRMRNWRERRAIPALLSALTNGDDYVRQFAARAFEDFEYDADWPEVVPYLLAAASGDPDACVRLVAQGALGAIQRHNPILGRMVDDLKNEQWSSLQTTATRISGPDGERHYAGDALRLLGAAGHFDQDLARYLERRVRELRHTCETEDTSHGGVTYWQCWGHWITGGEYYLDAFNPRVKERGGLKLRQAVGSLATLPHDPRTWEYEVKFDGYRAVAFKAGGNVQLRFRNDNLQSSVSSDCAGPGEAGE